MQVTQVRWGCVGVHHVNIGRDTQIHLLITAYVCEAAGPPRMSGGVPSGRYVHGTASSAAGGRSNGARRGG